MRSASKSFILVLLAGSVLYGQDPASVKYDTPQVKVFIATEQPHHASPLHEHKLNRVLVYLDGGTMSFTTPDGKVEKRDVKAGEAVWSAATGPHVSENISNTLIRLWEIELKAGPGAPKPVSELDPAKVDTKHYSLEFENPQVRVLRVRFAPGEGAPLHEHKLNRVVVCLTDQKVNVTADGKTELTQHKAGDVSWGGAAKHSEQNVAGGPFEVVVVELKI